MMQGVPNYLENLRAATTDAHRELELYAHSPNLLSNSPTKEIYKKLIQAHYTFHLHIASLFRMHSSITPILDWPNCARIDELRKDLMDLDLVVKPLNVTHNFNSTINQAYVFGICYVSEGSCLGNQMMLKHLEKSEIFNSWNAKSFFESCTVNFKERWQTFLKEMHHFGINNYEDLETGALDGFAYFKQCLLIQN